MVTVPLPLFLTVSWAVALGSGRGLKLGQHWFFFTYFIGMSTFSRFYMLLVPSVPLHCEVVAVLWVVIRTKGFQS